MYLLQAKKDQTNVWLGILGIIVIFIGQILGMYVFTLLLSWHVARRPEIGVDAINRFFENPDFSILNMDLNLGLTLMIVPFAIAMLVIIFWIKKVHQRPFRSLITPLRKIQYAKIFYAFFLWLMLCLVMELFSYYVFGIGMSFHFELKQFLILVLISIFLLPIQTSYEELYVRGYVMQVFSKVSDYRWVPIVISVIIFSLMHGSNPEVSKYGFLPMMLYYVVAATFLAIITIMDDSLELALGVHWATNFVGTVVVNYDSSALQTYSLLKAGEANPLMISLLLFLASIIFIIICAKKYKWPSFNILLQKIEHEN